MDGAQIRAARERRGWTQQRLAKELGVGFRTVGNWERGETVPRNRMGMLQNLFGDEIDPDAPDPLREASDLALLAELTRRAIDRERR